MSYNTPFPNYGAYDTVLTDADLYHIVGTQIQEMELVRGKIFQLEQTHLSMKQKYVP